MAGETTVGEFCPFTYGKGLPERNRVASGKVLVYGSNGIVGQHSEVLTSGPSVIIGRKGTVGAIHLSVLPCWPIDTTFYIEFESVPKARYAYYLLKTLGLTHMNFDSAVPGLNRDAAHARRITVVEEPQRDAIACILGALDDKIELNRRMNGTLEDTARAIFKSWFVDFDPVRAKAAGQQPPGLKPEIAALFPGSFEESELGEIPKGWRVGSVGELADVSSGKRPHTRFTESCDVATIPLWGGNGPMAFVSEQLFDKPILLTGRVGTLGSVFRITSPCWPSDNTLVVQAKTAFAFEYLYLRLQEIDFASLNRGSTQPLLTQTDLKRQRLLLPTDSALGAFNGIANPLYGRCDGCTAEMRTLAALRDTLLPKLISGELPVPDAERIAGRCL